MENLKAINDFVTVQIKMDVLCRKPQVLTEEEDYKLESLHMLADDIKEDMSSAEINKAFDLYIEWHEVE